MYNRTAAALLQGLGEKDQLCRVFADATNVGDGHVNCNPDAPVPKG